MPEKEYIFLFGHFFDILRKLRVMLFLIKVNSPQIESKIEKPFMAFNITQDRI